jgi:hypothetical protein
MSHATSTTVSLAIAAALFAGCEPKPGEPPKPKSGETVAAANIPAGIVSDPSVPPASQVMNENPAATGQETTAARPTGEPRKEEGTQAMPKPQGNNESSPPSDAAAKPPPQQQ